MKDPLKPEFRRLNNTKEIVRESLANWNKPTREQLAIFDKQIRSCDRAETNQERIILLTSKLYRERYLRRLFRSDEIGEGSIATLVIRTKRFAGQDARTFVPSVR